MEVVHSKRIQKALVKEYKNQLKNLKNEDVLHTKKVFMSFLNKNKNVNK